MKKCVKSLSLIVMLLMAFMVTGCQNTGGEAEKLPQPTNVQVSDSYILSWDIVEGAKEYDILVGGKTLTTANTSYDLSTELVEGKNLVWVYAVGDGKKYLNSAGVSIEVSYTKYSDSAFVDAIKEAYKSFGVNRDDFATEEELDEYCLSIATTQAEMLTTISNDVEITREELLNVNLVFICLSSGKFNSDTFAMLMMLHEEGVANNVYAKLIYNYLILMLNQMDPTGQDTYIATAKYLLSGNQVAVISTVEVFVEYIDNVLTDMIEISQQEMTSPYQAYMALIEILLGEKNRITTSDLTIGINAVHQIIATLKNAVPETEVAAKSAFVLIDEIVKFSTGIYDPMMEISYKVLTCFTENDFNVVVNAVNEIANLVNTELTDTTTTLIINNLTSISNTISTAISNVDLSVEMAEIQAAIAELQNGEAPSALIDVVSMLMGIPRAEIEAMIEALMTVINEYDPATMTEEELFANILNVFGLTIDDFVAMVKEALMNVALTYITEANIEQVKATLNEVSAQLTEIIAAVGETFTFEELINLIPEPDRTQILMLIPDDVDLTVEYDVSMLVMVLAEVNNFIDVLTTYYPSVVEDYKK